MKSKNTINTQEKEGWKRIKCTCGSIRINAKVSAYNESWILVECRNCGNTLYYNGA